MKITDCIFLGIILAVIASMIIRCARNSKDDCKTDLCTLEAIKFNDTIRKMP